MTDLYRQPTKHPEPYGYRPRADGTVGCRECGDSQWVEVDSHLAGIPTVRPCSRCLPATYERWVLGFPDVEKRRGGEPVFRPDPTRVTATATPTPTQESF